MTNKALLLAFASASLGAVACSSASSTSHDESPPPTPIADSGPPQTSPSIDQAEAQRDAPSAAALGSAVTANNAFALNLYGQLAPTANGGNVITSPLSASLALTMTYAGAQGQTQTEMAAALQIDPSAGSVFDGQNALTQALAGRAAAALAAAQQVASSGLTTAPLASDYALQVVNSVWGEKTYPWAAPFLGVLAASYGTGVYLEDFIGDPTGATNTINGWVSTQTGSAINNLLPANALDSTTRMVLVNAVHLKLPWQTPFDPMLTASGTFTRGDGSTVSASFMHEAVATSSYVETPDAQVVSLPLADNQLSVVFALPKNGITGLVSSLTPARWAAMTTSTTTETNVVLSLPKFTTTSKSFSLVSALQALGMKAAFDPVQADFKGLCPVTPDGQNLYVSDVLQKAMMEVAETGVQAAAATAVLVSAGAVADPPVTVTLTLDQPFLVSIVDQSGAIVFLGQINDPTDPGNP